MHKGIPSRVLSAFLAFTLVTGLSPMTALAAQENVGGAVPDEPLQAQQADDATEAVQEVAADEATDEEADYEDSDYDDPDEDSDYDDPDDDSDYDDSDDEAVDDDGDPDDGDVDGEESDEDAAAGSDNEAADDGIEDFWDWHWALHYEVYPYTGQPVALNDGEPFTRLDGTRELIEGVDYCLEFQDENLADLEGAPTDPGGYWVRLVALEGGCCKNRTSFEKFYISTSGINDLRWSKFELSEKKYNLDLDENFSLAIKQMKSYAGADLLLGRDCDLKFYSCGRWAWDDKKEEMSGVPENSGYYLVQIVAKEGSGYTGSSDTCWFYIERDNDLEKMKLQLSASSYPVTGKGVVIKHEPIVNSHGRELVEGRDYVLKYYSWDSEDTATPPVLAGSYKVYACGIGSYVGTTESVAFEITPNSIAKAKLVLSKASYTYNGKAQKPSVKTVGGKALKAGTDYTVKYSNAKSKDAGSYTVTVVGKGNYAGTSAKATYKIAKAKNPLKAKAVAKSVKAKAAKKKAQSVSGGVKITKKGAGAVSYAKVAKGSAKQLSVDKKTGKITVKKGTKKGAYKVKVKVSAKGDKNYKVGSQTVTVTVKVS